MSASNHDETSAAAAQPRPVPERFQVAKATLYVDRFMTSAIAFGGIGIVAAVFGIFVFILSEITPLFQEAHIEFAREMSLVQGQILGLDEWSELPFVFDGHSKLTFQPVYPEGAEPITQTLELPEAAEVSSFNFDARNTRLALGTTRGEVGLFDFDYTAIIDNQGKRVVSAEIESGEFFSVSEYPVSAIDYADSSRDKLFAAVCETPTGHQLFAVHLSQARSLLGGGAIVLESIEDLTPLLEGEEPVSVLTAQTADSIVVVTADGDYLYLFRSAKEWTLRQRFTPFEDIGERSAGASYLIGDVSIVTHSSKGDLRIYSLYIPEGESRRIFRQTKDFGRVEGGIDYYVPSQRNKSFLVGNSEEFLLCHGTSESIRKRMKLPFTPVSAAIDAKMKHIGFLDPEGSIHLYELDDHHPEAGWRAFFGRVWYEGSPKPRHVWQSTGGSDDFEPKLSLVPLIIGSLKGTFYAMLFAVPIALLAAIYVSHFAHPDVKRTVKPLIEIMASLPSVVLGFLAALWLAPLIETRVPSVFTVIVLIPIVAAIVGYIWSILPVRYRNSLPRGTEFAILIPILGLTAYIGWSLGPVIESMLFVATMDDGRKVADFRLWWPQATGLPYEQRNCLVVGFMMGFAVIPVIFTIAEDSLANVPPSITSASEALGASRWQVVRTIVLPIAAAGIFSALMIGFGRAVGETMVVVMATGNTPIMDESGRLIFGSHWNIFNGMRTLSANIAVELPEAPVHSTHYRALFLGAMALFIMTFVLNTAAELLRQHLREKFKIV